MCAAQVIWPSLWPRIALSPQFASSATTQIPTSREGTHTVPRTPIKSTWVSLHKEKKRKSKCEELCTLWQFTVIFVLYVIIYGNIVTYNWSTPWNTTPAPSYTSKLIPGICLNIISLPGVVEFSTGSECWGTSPSVTTCVTWSNGLQLIVDWPSNRDSHSGCWLHKATKPTVRYTDLHNCLCVVLKMQQWHTVVLVQLATEEWNV